MDDNANRISLAVATTQAAVMPAFAIGLGDTVARHDGAAHRSSAFPSRPLDAVGVRVPRVDARTLDSHTVQTLTAM